MTTQRKFRFGAGVMNITSRRALIDAVRKIEDLGYDIFSLADHFAAQWLPPLTALMAAADATTRLRVGTTVFDNDFRHPAVLAREAAALDLLSDGRFELGLGAGWLASDYTQTGIAFDPPKVRVDRLIEAVSIIKRFFEEDTVSFHGLHYTVEHLVAAPKPVQQPHPPIMVAGSGRRMLSLAAREADIVGLLMSSVDSQLHLADSSSAATLQRIDWIKTAAAERFPSLELNTCVFSLVVTDYRRQAAEELAREWRCTAEDVLDSTHVLVGSTDHICEQLQMWREHFGITYITIAGEENIDALAPIVSRLSGT